MRRFRYLIDIADPGGTRYDIVDDFVRLSYTQRVNTVGMITFELLKNHKLAAGISLDSIVTVYRGQPHTSVNWPMQPEVAGLYRGLSRSTNEFGNETITFYVPDGLSLLSRAIVAYKAGASGAQWSAPVYQILKDVANQNGNTAIGGRLLPIFPGPKLLATFLAAATGTTANLSLAYQNLLSALQQVADIDQEVLTSSSLLGSTFHILVSDLAADDVSDQVVFDLGLSTIVVLEIDERRIYEPTVALVGGQGEGAARTTVVRYASSYATNNHTEIFVDARDAATTAELETRGDARLAEHAYRPQLRLRVAQTPGLLYGVDYGLRSRVKVRHRNTLYTQRIVGVTVSVSASGAEEIEIELDDV